MIASASFKETQSKKYRKKKVKKKKRRKKMNNWTFSRFLAVSQGMHFSYMGVEKWPNGQLGSEKALDHKSSWVMQAFLCTLIMGVLVP